MKNLAIIIVVLGVVGCAHVSEDKNQTKSINTTDAKSTDEEHSETLHAPTYVLADSGLLVDTPRQYVALHPDTPVYNSVYAVKSSSPYLRQADYGDNYIDHEYNSILSLTHNIPGIPGTDYPLYAAVPYTGFSCHEIGRPGFYADVTAGCQVWHYCQPDGRHDAFLCPNGTIFDQKNRVCNWWYNVRCQDSQYWYAINDDLYRIPKKKNLIGQYYDHYYLPSEIIETKTKPPGTSKSSADKPLKFHPAIVVKIPKQTYQYIKEDKSGYSSSGIHSEYLVSPTHIQSKEKFDKRSPKP